MHLFLAGRNRKKLQLAEEDTLRIKLLAGDLLLHACDVTPRARARAI